MKTIKTSELVDSTLDWAVCVANGETRKEYLANPYPYSTNWVFGGPIIEREGLCLIKTGTVWQCTTNGNALHSHAKEGPIALIAAMRCYVASKLGDTVEVPEELL